MNDDTERTPVIQVRNLGKVYGIPPVEVYALRGIDLDVHAGEFVAIMGPSGSGKSTLLHVLGGIETPSFGDVLLEGVNMGTLDDDKRTILRRRRLGFIFQKINLLAALTAVENVALPLLLDGVDNAEAHRRALHMLGLVNLAHRVDHVPDKMSGGEQQRVAIARALVIRPAVILADEPTGALDSANADNIVNLLQEVVEQHGQTIVLVTHDPQVAARAHRVIEVRDGLCHVHAISSARS